MFNDGTSYANKMFPLQTAQCYVCKEWGALCVYREIHDTDPWGNPQPKTIQVCLKCKNQPNPKKEVPNVPTTTTAI